MDPTHEAAAVKEEATAKAERAASSAPAGTAGNLLALQRSIGNRAVGKLLREIDPRLTYTDAAIAEGTGLDAQKLPWTSPGKPEAGWNALEILSKLTQIDESGVTFTDKVRCGANSVLAVAVTKGPLTTEGFARGVMLHALHQSEDTKLTAEKRKTGREVYDKIWPAIRGVGNGTATYGDLSLIAHYAKVAMTEKAASLTTGHELGTMVAQVGGMHASAEPILDQEHLKMYAKSLKPGDSYIVLTGTNVLPTEVKRRSLDQTDHYVVLGKDPSGSVFLYDPWPRVGTQLLRSKDANFWTLFMNKEGDWKASFIFARPNF